MTSKTDNVAMDQALDEAVKYLLEFPGPAPIKAVADSRKLPYVLLVKRLQSSKREILNKNKRYTKCLSPEQEKMITNELLKRNGQTRDQIKKALMDLTFPLNVDCSTVFVNEFLSNFLLKHRFEFKLGDGKPSESELTNCFRDGSCHGKRWSDKELQLLDMIQKNKDEILRSNDLSSIWTEISNKIGVPATACANRWRNIRNRHKFLFVLNHEFKMKPDSKKYNDKRLSFLFKFYKDLGLTLCREEPVYDDEDTSISHDKDDTTEDVKLYTTKSKVKERSALKNIVTQDMVEEVLKQKKAPNNDVFEDLAAKYVKTLKFERSEENILKIVADSAPVSNKDLDIPDETKHSLASSKDLSQGTEACIEDNKETVKIIHPDEMSVVEYFCDISEYIMHQFPVEKHEQLRKNALSIVAKAVQDKDCSYL